MFHNPHAIESTLVIRAAGRCRLILSICGEASRLLLLLLSDFQCNSDRATLKRIHLPRHQTNDNAETNKESA